MEGRQGVKLQNIHSYCTGDPINATIILVLGSSAVCDCGIFLITPTCFLV